MTRPIEYFPWKIRNTFARENRSVEKFAESTSATQAAKALQANVLGSERSDLLSATIFDDPEKLRGS